MLSPEEVLTLLTRVHLYLEQSLKFEIHKRLPLIYVVVHVTIKFHQNTPTEVSDFQFMF